VSGVRGAGSGTTATSVQRAGVTTVPSDEPRYNGGSIAEAAAARKYGLELRDGSTGWWDAKHRSNGRKVQVKAARHTRSGGDPGVIRCWREHLRDLRDHGGSVVVVVVAPSNPERTVLRVEKVSPSELLRRGDFRATGQEAMRGMHEARLAWNRVVSF